MKNGKKEGEYLRYYNDGYLHETSLYTSHFDDEG